MNIQQYRTPLDKAEDRIRRAEASYIPSDVYNAMLAEHYNTK